MRKVLIIGGSRGIGAAMVRRFTQAGDKVYFTFLRSRREAEQLAAEYGAIPIQADAAVGVQVARAVRWAEEGKLDPLWNRDEAEGNENGGQGTKREDTRDEGGLMKRAEAGREQCEPHPEPPALDVLVCNAGVSLTGMLTDVTDAEFRRVLDVNIYGTFAALRAALPGMFWRRRGAIVTVSSIWGQEGASCEAVYSASKAAVIGLTQAAARETAGSGIRVNCVAPGFIDTEMNSHLSPGEKAEVTGSIPMGRAGTPEEVAETVFFLAGEAASYLTGQVIGVNGGWHV